jgi:hypothetical protein
VAFTRKFQEIMALWLISGSGRCIGQFANVPCMIYDER